MGSSKSLKFLRSTLTSSLLALGLTLCLGQQQAAADLAYANGIIAQATRNLEVGGAELQKQSLLLLSTMGKEATAAVPAIAKLLTNSSADIIVDALRTLESIGSPDALLEIEKYARDNLPRLIQDLADGGRSPLGATSASRILGQLGDYALDAVPSLFEMSTSSDAALRDSAESALGQILKASGVRTTFGYQQDFSRFIDRNTQAAEDEYEYLKRKLR